MLAKKVKEDVAEGNFFFLPRYDMRHLIHGHANALGQTLFQRKGCSRASNNILPRMYDQCGGCDIAEVGADTMAETGLNKAKMG